MGSFAVGQTQPLECLAVRSVIAFVAILAALKFGYQEWVYRSALVDTLMTTYRQDAVESCQKEAKARNLAIGYGSWNDPESLQLIVGHSSREANANTTDLTGTPASPFLVIVARQDPAKIQCEFDIVRMSAAVFQL